MPTLACPRCGDPVRLLEDSLPIDSSVRCSWCQETFTLAEITRNLPPALEVVSLGSSSEVLQMGIASGVAVAGAGLAAAGLATVTDFDLGSSDEVSSEDPAILDPSGFDLPNEGGEMDAASIDLDAGGIQIEQDVHLNDGLDIVESAREPIAADSMGVNHGELELAPLRPMKVNQDANPAIRPSRSSRKKGSSIKGVLAIAIGGLLSLPIAGGILALAGRPLPLDFGFWPFNGGDQGSTTRVSATPSVPRDRTPKPSLRDSPLASSPLASSPLVVPDEIADIPETDTAEEALSAISGMNAEALRKPKTSIETLEPRFALPDSEALGANESKKPIAEESPKPSSADAFPSLPGPGGAGSVMQPSDLSLAPEISNMVSKSNELLDAALLGAGNEVDSRQGVKFFRRVCMLADSITPEMVDQDSSRSIASMLGRIHGTKLEEFVRTASSKWIMAPAEKRGRSGTLVLGTAKRDSSGEMQIELAKGGTVKVISSEQPIEGEMIGLGTIDSSSGTPTLNLSIAVPVR